MTGADVPAAAREAMVAGEVLGRIVREAWVEWAREQPDPKPSWLVPWESLDDGQREVDIRIGRAVWAAALEWAAQLAEQKRAEYVDSDPCTRGAAWCRGVIKNPHAPFASLLRQGGEGGGT